MDCKKRNLPSAAATTRDSQRGTRRAHSVHHCLCRPRPRVLLCVQLLSTQAEKRVLLELLVLLPASILRRRRRACFSGGRRRTQACFESLVVVFYLFFSLKTNSNRTLGRHGRGVGDLVEHREGESVVGLDLERVLEGVLGLLEPCDSGLVRPPKDPLLVLLREMGADGGREVFLAVVHVGEDLVGDEVVDRLLGVEEVERLRGLSLLLRF